jgi:hypothetical protein
MVDDRYRSDYSHESSRSEDNASGRGAVDPLTELARLIGQSDPYADLKARRAAARLAEDQQDSPAAPGWLARPAPSGYDQQQEGYADDGQADSAYAYRQSASDHHDAGPEYDDGSVEPQQSYADGEQAAREAVAQYSEQQYADHQYSEPRYADAQYAREEHTAHARHDDYDDRYHITPPPAGGYESDEYDDEGHLPPRGEGEGALRAPRRGGLITIAAVLGLAVIGTAGAFAYRAFTGPSADSPPPVIKADPTPVKAPPAAPAADAQDKAFTDRAGPAGNAQAERIVPREETPVAQPAPAWPAPPRPGSGVSPAMPLPTASTVPAGPEPKRVRTLTIRPDANGDVTQATPAAPPAKSAAPTRTAKAEPATAAAGAYVVQLSAQKSENEAKESYRSLQAKYPSVLGNREASIRRADLDKGVYYRVQLGPFATMASANAFCDELKNAGGQCIVQKN